MKREVPVNDASFGNLSECEADAFETVEGVGLLEDLLMMKELR